LGESFWQQVEGIFNVNYLVLFTNLGATSFHPIRLKCCLGIDDDKLHFNWQRDVTDHDGLKPDHHAQDNRHGYTAHTGALSATAAPLQVMFQRSGENVYDTTNRMIDFIFGKHTGKATDLVELTVGFNRGYTNGILLFDLLDRGADINCTSQHMEFVPLTFGHKENDKQPFPEKAKNFDKEGFKDCEHMRLEWKGKKEVRELDCAIFRSGIGMAAALILSSVFCNSNFDFIPKDEQSMLLFHDKTLTPFERKQTGLSLLEGSDDDDECATMVFAQMEPHTMEQNTADWFVDHQMATASSTVYNLLMAAIPNIDEDESVIAAFKTVLSYPDVDHDLIGKAWREQQARAEEELGRQLDEDGQEEKDMAQRWIDSLCGLGIDNEFKSDMLGCDDPGDEPDEDAITENVAVLNWMHGLLKQQGKANDCTPAALAKFFTQWLSGERDKCMFSALNVAELKRLCKDAGIKMTGLKQHDMIEQLSLPEHLRVVRKDTRKKTRPVDTETAPLVALFRQSFLRPEPDGPRLAAAIGHRNEEPFLRSFFQVSQEQGEDDNEFSFGSLHVRAVFRCGLMRKVGSKIAKASLDAITFLETENGLELIPTEIKSRVSMGTMVQARRLLETFVGAELYDDRKQYLIKTTSDDPLFKLLIHDKCNPSRCKKEALQLLHDAFVAGSNRGLLLAGSKKQLMNGILVAFQQDLLDAYAAVVTFLYNKFFRPFYEMPVNELLS